MQETWLKQDGAQDLVIFILGWAATPNAVQHIAAEGCDIFCVDDYREMHTLRAEDFSSYRRIYLFAWSFGVWVAEQIATELPLYKAIALNGTPLPVDDRYGMRLRVVLRTMQGLAKVGMNPFNEKTYGTVRAIPEGPFEDRSIEAKIDELQLLAERSKDTELDASRIPWTQAYIADKDEIFPPQKMWDYWQARGLGVGFESYHYPFSDPTIVLDHLDA